MNILDELVNKFGVFFESKEMNRKQTLGDLFGNISDNQLKKIKMNSGNGSSQFEADGEKSKQTLINILTKKSHIYKKLIEFCNITGGVGTDIHSDNKTDNAGQVSDQIINSRLDALKKDTEQLIKYENAVVKLENPSGKKLMKILDSIETDLLDWDTKETPRITKALKEPIYAYSFKKSSTGKLERVSRPTLIGPGTMKIGKPRYNADIFEDLYPFIIEFADPRRNVDLKKLLKDVVDSKETDDNKNVATAIDKIKEKTDLEDDFLSNHGKKAPKTKEETPEETKKRLENRELRKKVMNKAIDAGEYESARENERAYESGEKSNTGSYSREMAEKGTHKLAQKYGLEKAPEKLNLKTTAKAENTGAEASGNAPTLKGTILKKADAILTAWEEKNPGKQAGIFVGTKNSSGSGPKILLLSKEFIDFSKTKTADLSPVQGQACVNGNYVFLTPNAFTLHTKHSSVIRNIAGKGVETELKQKIKKAIGAASIFTEEVSYFNY